jgi:hypothetical protein
MTSIQSDINELNEVNQEIKRLSAMLKKLRKQSKDIELRIADYLKDKDTPGVKFQGYAIVLEQKEKFVKKKKVEQEMDAIQVLENYNINNPSEALKEIIQARRGESTQVNKLKIKKIK